MNGQMWQAVRRHCNRELRRAPSLSLGWQVNQSEGNAWMKVRGEGRESGGDGSVGGGVTVEGEVNRSNEERKGDE